MIVADSNLIAYLLIPGTFSGEARSVLERDNEWVAPALWRSEIRNVLSLYVTRGQLSLADALTLMEQAEVILGNGEYDISSADVLSLAAKSRCSAYDCEFVALAANLGVPLVTHDRQILRAFPGIARTSSQFLATSHRI